MICLRVPALEYYGFFLYDVISKYNYTIISYSYPTSSIFFGFSLFCSLEDGSIVFFRARIATFSHKFTYFRQFFTKKLNVEM